MAHIDDTTSDLLTRVPGLFRRWELAEFSDPPDLPSRRGGRRR